MGTFIPQACAVGLPSFARYAGVTAMRRALKCPFLRCGVSSRLRRVLNFQEEWVGGVRESGMNPRPTGQGHPSLEVGGGHQNKQVTVRLARQGRTRSGQAFGSAEKRCARDDTAWVGDMGHPAGIEC